MVVGVVAGSVGTTAIPLTRGHLLNRAVADLEVQRDGAEAALRQHPDLLRVAVGDRELEVEQRLLPVLRIDVVLVQIERLDIDADR